MKDLICDEFQNKVNDLLIRHHSILDVLSKLAESTARINRGVCKSVNDCGCLSIQAKKVAIPEECESIDEMRRYLDAHVRGKLCPNCEEVIMNELGKNLFYMAALCNILGLNLYDVFIHEYKKASALGIFNMT